jgi:hypothetical protein
MCNGIKFACFYDFPIRLSNRSDSVVLFVLQFILSRTFLTEMHFIYV